MARTRLPELHALELLVAVSETGSLSQAAAKFRISQPSASARMRALERRLGVTLLYRSPTGSRLTPAGQVVTDWARGVLDAATALVEGAAALQARQQNKLRVSSSLTIAEHLLPGWIVALRGQDPDVAVGLTVANSNEVIERLRRGEAELGFVEGPRVPRDMRYAAVGHDRLLVAVAPAHPWARRRAPVSAAELAAEPLLVREPGSGTRETLENALARHDLRISTLLELGSTGALRAAALSGTGPAVLSVLAVTDDLAAGRLVSTPVADDVRLDRTLRAVWCGGTRLGETPSRLLALARATVAGRARASG